MEQTWQAAYTYAVSAHGTEAGMDKIFLKVLNMSIAAGWLILAVIVVRLLLRRAPKRLTCVMWAVVAVRLLCPFFLESSFSLIPSGETINAEVVRFAPHPVIDSGIPVLNEVLNPMIDEQFAPEPGVSVNPLYVWMAVAGIVWIAGVAMMVVYALVSSLRMRIAVREAVPLGTWTEMREDGTLGIRAKVREAGLLGTCAAGKEAAVLRDHVWLCDAVRSPFILGTVRPRIYLPSGIDEEQMSYILAHEQAHVEHLDHCLKPFGWLLLSVYWFHPLVWTAYVLFCRDLELACDERVVGGMDLDGRKTYSQALLACSLQRKLVFSYPLAFGEVGVKERVKSILHYRKPAAWLITVAVFVCVVVAVCFLTNPKERVDDSKIRYLDQWYSRSDLSEETIAWLEWYNSLPEEAQLAVSSVPHDLYDLEGYGGGPDIVVETVDAVHGAGSAENMSDDIAETVNAEDATDMEALSVAFGIPLQLPGNDSWIQSEEYRQLDEHTVEVDYWDAVAGADCKMIVVRDGELDLSEPDTVYDAAREVTWMGSTKSGETIYVKVQCASDGKQVLATWEYDSGQHQYQFAVWAKISVENADISSVPKAALSLISNLE